MMKVVVHQTFPPYSDGVVTLRPPETSDVAMLISRRDEEFDRWLGAEAEMAPPFACVVVAERVFGWIDYDVDRSRLEEDEVNVGYYLFASDRGNGHATRALKLSLQFLADATSYNVATLRIGAENERSLAVARRAMFGEAEGIGGAAICFKRDVETLRHTEIG